MFTYLKKRAEYLKKGKFEEAEKVEKKMTEWKNNNIDKCRTPVLAFITLETEGAKNKINNTKIPFYGDFLKFKRAPEATDVIWENQHYKAKQRRCRLAIVASIMILVLAAVLYLLNNLYK